MRTQTLAGPLLLGIMLIPPVAVWLETTMTGQMLVQIPLLIASGYGIGRILERKIPSLHLYMGGIPGLVMIVFTMVFWMIPRSLDHALTSLPMECAKYVTLVLFAGIPLGVGLHRLGFIARDFIWIHLISMVFLMDWLYAASPIRVCNRYLIDQQKWTGWILLGVGVAIILYHLGMTIFRTFKEYSNTEGIV